MTSSQAAPRVLLFGNLKGGVGKTTHCVHVAAALGRAGRRCLVWDLDANQGATQHLGIDGDLWQGTTEVLTGEAQPLDVVITSDEDGCELPENVHLIPASRRLERVTLEAGRPVPALPVAALGDRYDTVLLDTAPNLTAPTTAGYRAADAVILTTFPDPLALRALAKALDTLEISSRVGTLPGRLLGVLLGNVPGSRRKGPTGLEGDLLRYLESRLGGRKGEGLLFSTIVSRSIAVPRAQMAGRTLFQTDPKHRVTRQYRQLAAEIEQRLEAS